MGGLSSPHKRGLLTSSLLSTLHKTHLYTGSPQSTTCLLSDGSCDANPLSGVGVEFRREVTRTTVGRVDPFPVVLSETATFRASTVVSWTGQELFEGGTTSLQFVGYTGCQDFLTRYRDSEERWQTDTPDPLSVNLVRRRDPSRVTCGPTGYPCPSVSGPRRGRSGPLLSHQ